LVSQQVINIHVNSKIPWKLNLTSVYKLQGEVTIREFCESIGLEWDVEALVLINDQIAHELQTLKNNDQILFIVPIVGG
jgi:sulfur carrier protein ThiS